MALTRAVVELDCAPVEVEADIGMELPALTVVGLPDAAVHESRERVRAAIKNSGCVFPLRRVTVNLVPADLPGDIAIGPLEPSDVDAYHHAWLADRNFIEHSWHQWE